MLKLNIPSQPLSQIPINYFRQAHSLTRKSCQKGLDLTSQLPRRAQQNVLEATGRDLIIANHSKTSNEPK